MEQFLRVLFIAMLLGSRALPFAYSQGPPATGVALEGIFNVSDLGGATYTIPLKVPEGIGGLQPSLALVYNSQAGNGIMGMGWSLSGLSAITRVGNNIYNDSKVESVKLTYGDQYALDGNRLIFGDNVPEAGLTVRTEIETFSEITLNNWLSTGPEYFTVVDQNGLTYEYGKSAQARATVDGQAEPYMWLLEKVTDLSGNSVIYS